MTSFAYDSVDHTGEHSESVQADFMHVHDSGALVFSSDNEYSSRAATLIIAPGSWHAAWRQAE
jgi:chaperone required for assembly of F1-ATPase